ncbi:MAG: HAD family hydrolase [Patescibacteria group bacterium]
MEKHKKIIFFDIGNTLTIDEPFLFVLYELIFNEAKTRRLVTDFNDMMLMREKLVLEEFDTNPPNTLGIKFFGEDWKNLSQVVKDKYENSWLDFNILPKGVIPMLTELSKKYALGICANQPSSAREHLKQLGLEDFFQVIGMSKDRNLKKPDLEFFKVLLSEAAYTPENALMIGDRIDNDIAPAQKLGMKTILVELAFKDYVSGDVSLNMNSYLASLERTPSRGPGKENQDTKPEGKAKSLDEIISLTEKIFK